MEIRVYEDKFQQQVVDLILSIQQQEYNIQITKEDQPDLLDISSFYQRGNGEFWVALHEDLVVGTISLLDIGNGQLALRKMFVNKNYRGPSHKVAQQLLNVALTHARVTAVNEIYLGTTPEFKAAQRFYEKNGFQSILKEQLPEAFPIVHVDRHFYVYILAE
ncbi:MAG: GNAT family N-acetyltransferase [Solibacillus sp.]